MGKKLVLLGNYRDEADRSYFERCLNRLQAGVEKIVIPWSFSIAPDKLDLLQAKVPFQMLVGKDKHIWFEATCADVHHGRDLPSAWRQFAADEDLASEAQSWYLVTEMSRCEPPQSIEGLYDWNTDQPVTQASAAGWRYAYWRKTAAREFLDNWRSGAVLPRQEALPCVRSFLLDCLDRVADRRGLSQTDRDFIRDRGRITPENYDRFRQSEYPLVSGLNPYYKQFIGRSTHPHALYDRIFIALGPVRTNKFGAAVRVDFRAHDENRLELGAISVGLMVFGRQSDAIWSRPIEVVDEVWKGPVAPRVLQLPGQRLYGLSWQPSEWSGTEADLIEEIAARLDQLLEAVAQLRSETLEEQNEAMSLLTARFQDRGYRFTPEQITTFYGALKAKGFVILAGLSGTGKTKLAQEFAAALGLERDHFLLAPVRPDWRDGTGLLGYWNPVMKTYEAPPFLRFVLRAAEEYRNAQRRAGWQAGPNQWRAGLVAHLGSVLTSEEGQRRIARQREVIDHFRQRHGDWTAADLDLLWRQADNGMASLRAARPLTATDAELTEVTEILCDQSQPLATRAAAATARLEEISPGYRQRARITRALAVLEPGQILSIVNARHLETLAQGLGVDIVVDGNGEAFWQTVADAAQGIDVAWVSLLKELQWPDADHAVRNVAMWYAYEFLAAQQQVAATGGRIATGARPYIAVVDEMNLARVEYYFADLLSIMETGTIEDGPDRGFSRGVIALHDQGDEVELDDGTIVPAQLRLPPNLYIIGTVNMDETTFAFSPKVLDRAFTIEFRDVDLSNYPPDPGEVVTDFGDTENPEESGEYGSAGADPASDNAPAVAGSVDVSHLKTKSDQIRHLYSCGMAIADIARQLGIRYQFAYNVIKNSPTPYTSAERTLTSDIEAGVRDETQFSFDLADKLLTDLSRGGRFARFTKDDIVLWADGRRALIADLDALNRKLDEHDLHFGYRVVDEILAFVGGLLESPLAEGISEADAFDRAVLMKVLPKFHGPLHRLEAPLEAVLEWAGPEAGQEATSNALPRYPRTYAKAQRMLRQAQVLGHGAF